ncbi:MAG: hypothetical protein ACLFV4_07625 [Candidatus Hydrogenedentota bacterium]
MNYLQTDRRRLRFESLKERRDRVFIDKDRIMPDSAPEPLGEYQSALMDETVERIVQAREAGAARMLAFGAHAIKNGLGPILQQLLREGWLTHLATNGAGIIHDWEFAFQGHTSEHVEENVGQGRFGMWQETGYYLNLAQIIGAYKGMGYGEAVAALTEHEGLEIPAEHSLRREIAQLMDLDANRAAAALDLLGAIQRFELSAGWAAVSHPYKDYALQAAAYQGGIPFTGHPMIGHDIIYLHPMNHCAAIGRTAQTDFLVFAKGVENISGGVYLSVGSAVMSPMIFEKAMSMAQNRAIQQGKRIHDHYIAVVDLVKSHWDWTQGEPPETNPDYYLRYNKSFSRMGGIMRYMSLDNRDFFLHLAQRLHARHTEGDAS